jgi:hypothetical protein
MAQVLEVQDNSVRHATEKEMVVGFIRTLPISRT